MNTIEKSTAYGNINISIEAISKIVGDAISSSYGIAGITNSLGKILEEKDFSSSIKVHYDKANNKYTVDIHVICMYPSKISEVVHEAQKKVLYELKNTFSITNANVNIYVERFQ